MSERYWRTAPLAVLAVAGGAALTLAGCSQSSTNGAASGMASGTISGSPAGLAAATGQGAFTSAQLRDALLAKVNGLKPAGATEAGDYGSLPDVKLSKESLQGVKVAPAKCEQASVTGFNSATFADAPASVVTFRVGRDGVSEVLVGASPVTAAAALDTHLPAGCAHYKATVAGKTFAYSVKELPLTGIAEQSRALNVKAAGYADVDVWSVVYRGTGFVGAVTIVGPDATQKGAEVLAQEAYAKASETLH